MGRFRGSSFTNSVFGGTPMLMNSTPLYKGRYAANSRMPAVLRREDFRCINARCRILFRRMSGSNHPMTSVQLVFVDCKNHRHQNMSGLARSRGFLGPRPIRGFPLGFATPVRSIFQACEALSMKPWSHKTQAMISISQYG